MAQFTLKLADGRTYGPADEDLLVRWAMEGRVPPDSVLLDEAGTPTAATGHPRLAPILRAPPTHAGPVGAPRPAQGDESLATLIPYRNPPALIGYYVSVASLIPVLGLVLGPAAVVLGVSGLQKRKREPRCKGMAHAIVAIVLGSLTGLANLALLMLPFVLTNR